MAAAADQTTQREIADEERHIGSCCAHRGSEQCADVLEAREQHRLALLPRLWTTPPAWEREGPRSRRHRPGGFEHLRLGAAQALFGGLDTVGIGEPDREVLGERRQWWGRNIRTSPEYVGEELGRRHIAQMIGGHGAETGHPEVLCQTPTQAPVLAGRTPRTVMPLRHRAR